MQHSLCVNLMLWILDSEIDEDLITVFVRADPHEGPMVTNQIYQILAPFLVSLVL